MTVSLALDSLPVKALEFSRSEARYVAAAISSRLRPGSGAQTGPLDLIEADPPSIPGPGWHRVTTRLAGICGSDLATVDGHSARYFEPWISFPFIPGHEVVGTLEDGSRIVVARARPPSPRLRAPLRRCRTGRR